MRNSLEDIVITDCVRRVFWKRHYLRKHVPFRKGEAFRINQFLRGYISDLRGIFDMKDDGLISLPNYGKDTKEDLKLNIKGWYLLPLRKPTNKYLTRRLNNNREYGCIFFSYDKVKLGGELLPDDENFLLDDEE